MNGPRVAANAASGFERWLPRLLIVVSALLVMPVAYMLNHPFWYDEAWVAVGTRSPLSYLPPIAFSAPAGWALLIRIPVPGEQGMRMFTLAFTAAAAYTAFLLGRDLGGEAKRDRLLVGGVAALAVLMSPWSLLRIDLKHYTAEAFMGLLVLWLAGRVEEGWERRRLLILAATAAVFSVLGWGSMFVSVGVFIALLGLACFQRNWGAARDVVLAGGSLAVVYGVVWWFLLRPFTWVISDYWGDAYLGGGVVGVLRQTWRRYSELMVYYPPGARLVALGLFLWGLVTIARRQPATALSVVLTGMFMVVLGRLELYPFLDRRTSHFVLIMFIAVVGIGAGSIAVKLLARSPKAGSILAVGLAGLLVWAGMPWFNRPSLANEDVRSQVRHIEAQRAEGDVIVVSLLARYGFGYYWKGGRLTFDRTVHFTPRVVDDGVILYELGDISDTLAEAMQLARAPGGSGRIWVVRTHLFRWTPEWEAAYAAAGIIPESIPVGPEPLQVFFVDR